MNKFDLVVVGGGPAGMAAALAAQRQGLKDILLVEREAKLGGILNQCFHRGFTLQQLQRQLTGPEYSKIVAGELSKTEVQIWQESTVLQVDRDLVVHLISHSRGYQEVAAKAVVLAPGCRERVRSAVGIHGSRPAGVFSAGAAQRLINLEGLLPGNRTVILGSGDVGLVAARRMSLAGAKILGVFEILSHASGLPKNLDSCLKAFKIPLELNTTIVKIHGGDRVTGVTTMRVDEQLHPIKDTEQFISCDTVLLSVGLVPENDIARRANVEIDEITQGATVGELCQTSREGIFICGNALQIHDEVHWVSAEGALAASGAVSYIKKELVPDHTHQVRLGEGINYVVPQRINVNNVRSDVTLAVRVKKVGHHGRINLYLGKKIVASKRINNFLSAEIIRLDVSRELLLAGVAEDLVVTFESSSSSVEQKDLFGIVK